jgi:hypothetical protein
MNYPLKMPLFFALEVRILDQNLPAKTWLRLATFGLRGTINAVALCRIVCASGSHAASRGL